jgi:Mce-associated membrane protein
MIPATGLRRGGVVVGAPARSLTLLTRTAAALAVLLVVLGALAFWLSGLLREEELVAADRRAALDAAGAHALSLLSLSYKTADADVRRILDTTTGKARADYAATYAGLKKITIADKVVQYGALRATGLVSIKGGTARVLVVADGVITWQGSKSQDRFYRWTMDLSKVGGKWLVAAVRQVA